MKGIVLLSGGLDSATLALWKLSEGYDLFALTYDYGQRHRVEIDRAKTLVKKLGIREHLVLPLPLDALGGSSLVNPSLEIPAEREIDGKIPSTYVPARNLIFLSVATGCAEARGVSTIFIAVNAVDYSGYPDCRPEFIQIMNKTLKVATRVGAEGNPIRVEAPMIRMSKADIVKKAVSLGLDFSLTHSCYNPGPGDLPCGKCDSCILRKKGFEEAGIPDPLEKKW